MRNLIFLLCLLYSTLSFGQLSSIQQQFERDVNLLENPGFEYGLVRYTATGSSTLTKETSSDVYLGAASGIWDASTGSEYLRSSALAVPKAFFGKTCIGLINYLWDGGSFDDIVLRVTNGTNPLSGDLELTVTSGEYREAFVSFACPSSGNVVLELQSTADAAAIKLDQLFLGRSLKYFTANDSSEVVFHGYYDTTTSCSWQNSGTGLDAFGDDADCPSITVDTISPIVAVNTADDDQPNLVFTRLPEGIYFFQVDGVTEGSAAPSAHSLAISDGTDIKGRSTGRADVTQDNPSQSITAVFTHAGGAKTFTIFSAAETGNINLRVDTQTRRLVWTVIRFPSTSTAAVTLETQGWHIDANIGGANPDITPNVSDYTEIIDSGLDLVLNNGSAQAGIACSTTNSSDVGDLTCSAGDESLGLVFVPPYSGKFKACASFSFRYSDATSFRNITFQVIRTANSAQTILSEGNVRMAGTTASNEAGNQGSPFRVCGYFDLEPVKTTIRLMHENNITACTGNCLIEADRSASVGGRDFHWEVTPWIQEFPQAVAISSVPTGQANSCPGIGNICSGSYTPTLDNLSDIATNVTAEGDFDWYRIGGIVCVGGQVDVVGFGTGDTSSFDISLPIASNFTATDDAWGTSLLNRSGNESAGTASSVVAGDDILMTYPNPNTALSSVGSVNFCYRVL